MFKMCYMFSTILNMYLYILCNSHPACIMNMFKVEYR